MSTVLVVEDSEPLGKLLAQTLGRAGHDSSWAATGADAVALASSTPPDVALIDVHLADMEGTDLAKALREMLPGVRIIGCSGEAPAAAVLQQFDTFLLKPVGLDTLIAAITAG